MPSDEHGEDSVKAGDTLLRAVWLVTVADIVMSLDNVIAIAAAAETAAARVDMAHALAIKTTLIVFGLATSVPLIIAGSALLMAVLERFPILVWAGAGLLGWVAGEIIDQGRRRGRLARRSEWSSAGTCGPPRAGAVLRGRGRLGASGAMQAQGRAGAAAGRRPAGAGGVSARRR